jgi:hypothetical protein
MLEARPDVEAADVEKREKLPFAAPQLAEQTSLGVGEGELDRE